MRTLLGAQVWRRCRPSEDATHTEHVAASSYAHFYRERSEQMNGTRLTGCRWLLGLAVLALVVGAATSARAQGKSCGAGIDPTFNPNGTDLTPTFVGDTVTIKLNLTAGTLSGGTQMTVNTFLYALDCPNDGGFSEPSKVPCANGGTTKFNFIPGTETIQQGCGLAPSPTSVSCSQGSGGAGNSQVLTCTPNIALKLTPFTQCFITFQARADQLPTTTFDASFNIVPCPAGQQCMFLGAGDVTGSCNNGLPAQAQGTTAIPVDTCSVTLDKCVAVDVAGDGFGNDTCVGAGTACTVQAGDCPDVAVGVL